MLQIKLNRLSKHFGSHAVIKDLCLTIDQAQSVCLLGANGAGKSTLLKILAGVSTDINGTRQVPFSKIGYLPQNDTLIPWLTIRKNLELGLNLQGKKRSDNSGLKLIEQLCCSFDLERYLNSRPGQLSGGQRRIVEIARTISINPDLIIMDEPFNGIDVSIKQSIIDFLNNYRKQSAVTIIFSTHAGDDALCLADKIILFESRPLNKFSQLDASLINREDLMLKLARAFSYAA